MEAVPGNSTTRPSDPSAVPVRRSVVVLEDISLKVVMWSNNFRMMMARLAKPGCTFEHDQLDLRSSTSTCRVACQSIVVAALPRLRG
jgi:hypothetical protein